MNSLRGIFECRSLNSAVFLFYSFIEQIFWACWQLGSLRSTCQVLRQGKKYKIFTDGNVEHEGKRSRSGHGDPSDGDADVVSEQRGERKDNWVDYGTVVRKSGPALVQRLPTGESRLTLLALPCLVLGWHCLQNGGLCLETEANPLDSSWMLSAVLC